MKLKHATPIFLHRKFRTLKAATLARREGRRIDLVFVDVLGKQVRRHGNAVVDR